VSATLVGYFDGACEPFNPGGLATGGWVIPERSIKGCAAYGRGEGATNNVAEYSAAIDCLRAMYRIGWRGRVRLYGDSKLVVSQFAGRWRCNAPHLQELLERLRKGATFFKSVELEWVPRAQNVDADAMSKVGFERYAVAHGFKPGDFGKASRR
jgi:ribonuclease HI